LFLVAVLENYGEKVVVEVAGMKAFRQNNAGQGITFVGMADKGGMK